MNNTVGRHFILPSAYPMLQRLIFIFRSTQKFIRIPVFHLSSIRPIDAAVTDVNFKGLRLESGRCRVERTVSIRCTPPCFFHIKQKSGFKLLTLTDRVV